MTLNRTAIGLTTLVLAGGLAPRDATAYTAAGDRLFPATLLLPQIAPGDEFYVNYLYQPQSGGPMGSAANTSNLNLVYAKTITDRLGIFIEETYSRVGRVGIGNAYGWQNLDGELKYLAVTDIPHEFLFTVGLERETGGTGAQRVGASPSGATAPRAYFGKGLGDLDIGLLRPLAISGYGGVQFADAAPRPNILSTGFVVEYSIPYLESKVQSLGLPEPFRRLTPMAEVIVTAPVGSSYGARSTALVGPGISYAGDGYEIAIEGLIPVTRATGRGFGVTAQLHLSLDFLAPDTIGKPIFNTMAGAVTMVIRRLVMRPLMLALVAAVWLTLHFGVAAAAPAGTVVAVSGQCFVEGQGRRAAMKTGDPVAVSDTIDVPAGGKARLQMTDGSVLSIASGSRMTISDYRTDASGQRQSAALALTQGLVRAVVAPMAQPASFEVSTAVGTAAVRSTDWFIEAVPGSAQVGVLSGSVALTSVATRNSVMIPARWGARLEAGRDPVPARVWALNEFEAVIARTDVR